ncbi:DNA methyltransferase [Geminicoccus flavidas]
MLSIQTFGFTNPVLVDEAGRILAGHGRVKAATQLGMDRVPTIQLAKMSEADKRAYALADNKLALNAGWDQKLLVKELRYIQELQIDYDLTLTGFSTPEIDLLFEADAAPPEPPLPMMTSPVVSQTGDLWLLGHHRLLCGDVTTPADLDRLMAGRQAQMVFTDPPYNVPIDGFCTGAGRNHHAEFAMASGEMSEAEFTRFLESILRLLAERCFDGALLYSCMDWRHLQQLLQASQQAGLALVNLIVWAKTAPGMGSFYRSQHELIPLFRKGGGKPINNVELGRHGRNRSNVWSYAAPSMLGGGRPDEVRLHPTVKPVKLVADALLDASPRRGIVLDPFLGSGTTLLAAENTGRHAFGWRSSPVTSISRSGAGRSRPAGWPSMSRAARASISWRRSGRRRCAMPRDYEVGYGKPPVHTRFRPGQSGNPRGRPKSSLNLDTLLQQELAEKILVREGNKALRVSKKQAMVKSLVAKALKGEVRAIQLLMAMLQQQEAKQGPAPVEVELSADEREVLAQLERRLLRGKVNPGEAS